MELIKETERNILLGNKFYYPKRGGACLSKCLATNDGVRIGSIACQKCKNCVDSNKDKGFIVCSEIESAVGLNSVAMKRRVHY